MYMETIELIKNKNTMDKLLTQFNFLTQYDRLGLIGICVVILSIGLVFADIPQNIFSTCVLVLCILTLFFVYKIYLMPSTVSLSQLMTTTFTMFMTIMILILYTIFCISNFSEELEGMPDGWNMYVKVFMSILMVQSLVAIYTLYFTTPTNNWMFCLLGATLNILLFVFLLVIYTMATKFRTDGFRV